MASGERKWNGSETDYLYVCVKLNNKLSWCECWELIMWSLSYNMIRWDGVVMFSRNDEGGLIERCIVYEV